MIITCRDCGIKFILDEGLLKKTGSKVQCSRCSTVFTAYPPISEVVPVVHEEVVEEVTIAEPVDTDTQAKRVTSGESHASKDGYLSVFDESDLELDETEPETGDTDLDLGDLFGDMEDDLTPEPVEQGLTEDIDLLEENTLFDKENMSMGVVEDVSGADLEESNVEIGTQTSPGFSPKGVTEDVEEIETLDLSDIAEMLETNGEPLLDEPEDQNPALDLNIDADDTPKSQIDMDIEGGDLKVSDLEEMLRIETNLEGIEALESDTDDLKFNLDTMLQEDEQILDDTLSGGADESTGYDLPDIENLNLTDDQKQQEKSIFDATAAQTDNVSDDGISEIDDADMEEIQPEIDFSGRNKTEIKEVSESIFSISDQDPTTYQEAENETEDYHDTYNSGAKKRVHPLILILLVIALLVGGSYGVMSLLERSGGKIPFFSKLSLPFSDKPTQPKTIDAGNLKMSPYDISSKFIENSKSGRLFIVTGKVRNDYSDSRGNITLKSNLYTEGSTLIKTETVFCGNMISDLDVSNMDMVSIRKKLSNQFADDKQSIIKVMPGQSIPFLVVFSDIPNNLQEFIIEVTGSTPM